jgi:cell division protein FtsN
MEMSKKLVVVMAGLSLGACSSMDDKNTFMTYTDLQDKVRMHEEQWQTVQPKLDRIDELEAEVAALKQGKPLSSDTMSKDVTNSDMMVDDGNTEENIAAVNVAPVVTPAPFNETVEPQETIAMAKAAPPVVSSPPITKEQEYGVQVASYANRDEAIRGWRVLLKSDPVSFNGLEPLINQKEVNGRTMYQLKVGPFINKSFSSDFCKMLKEKGKDCLVAQYNGEAFSSN